MRVPVVLFVVAGLLVGADDPKKDGGKKGTKVLEGSWVIVSITRDGKTETPDKKKGGGWSPSRGKR